MTDDKLKLCKWCEWAKANRRYNHVKCRGNDCNCPCLQRADWKPYQDYHHVNF